MADIIELPPLPVSGLEVYNTVNDPEFKVTGDNKFVYDATTKLWKTGTLTL